MKKSFIILFTTVLMIMQLSCSSTLQRRYDQRHGTTTYDSDSDRYRSRSSSDDTYRRDYSKIPDNTVRTEGSSDYDRTLLAQYQEMDKLGELVAYEIDILERRWNVLISEYKNAKGSSREVISNELDRIGDDQKTLYKAYTNIYRNGKNNWTTVKAEVENTLRSVRRFDK